MPHQIAAARRILNDPLQRYLLADEVGLGKTIEAGIVIRQFLLDDPEARVLVLVPPGLVTQWHVELETKFRIRDFAEAVDIRAHEEVPDTHVPALLVVDEAHRVINDQRLRHLAHASPRLLLLSATPVLGDAQTFLALLNLLDPQVYRVGDLDSFRAKLEQRQAFGRLLLGLQSDAPAFVLKRRAAEALQSFPGDDTVAELAPRLAELAAADNTPELDATCSALRQHIADTYRIHQRIIRFRRADAEGWEFRPRGPPVCTENQILE